MTEVFKVGMAESRLAQPPQRLACFGIGSCVCVALYDPQAQVAGLAHSMLPLAPAQGLASAAPEEKAKYADSATLYLLECMEKLGAKRQRIFARLVGGATMFSFPGKTQAGGELSLGERNLRAARESLKAQGISVTAEESGGSVGRSIEFDPLDGSLLVRSAWQEIRWL